jgi:hypothetical protein
MPPTASADLALINDGPICTPAVASPAVTDLEAGPANRQPRLAKKYDEGFAALDRGLAIGGLQPDQAEHDTAPAYEPHDVPDDYPVRAQTRVTFMISAIVLLACLTAGAAAAAYVFQDRVTGITEPLTATR